MLAGAAARRAGRRRRPQDEGLDGLPRKRSSRRWPKRGPPAEPQLLRLHRHAEVQDAGGLRRNPAPTASPQPFHLYTMRQAIEEGFILDVLEELHDLQDLLPA